MQDKGKLVHCPGRSVSGTGSSAAEGEGHGSVDMYRALVQSCDVYFYTLGLKLDPTGWRS